MRVCCDPFQDVCDLEKRTYEGYTALILACERGNVRCVEHLVGYGADVQATTTEENSPLHFVLSKKDMKPLSQWTPHLNEVLFKDTNVQCFILSTFS